ncbi:MAG: hypothetical protein ACNA75_09545 [Thiohalomonadaceae bacterium]
MRNTKVLLVLGSALLFFASSAMADNRDYQFYDFAPGKLFAGGGLSHNTISWSSYDNALGVQGFFGWDFFRFQKMTVAGEVGYFSTGKFDSNVFNSRSFGGPYVNAVAKYPLNDTVWVQGRVGHSAISGVGSSVIGGGFGFKLWDSMSLRTEAVSYSQINSLRAELVFDF